MQDKKNKPINNERNASENKFLSFLNKVFVHNIGYKLLALTLSILCWILFVCVS